MPHTPGEDSEDNDGTDLYSTPDELGSSAGVLNGGGATDATEEYDAFGDMLGSSGSLPVSYPFDQGYGAGAGDMEAAARSNVYELQNYSIPRLRRESIVQTIQFGKRTQAGREPCSA